MNIEKMREEFEAAFRQEFGFGRLTAGANADAANMLKAAEWAWQASRAAVVVDLPSDQCIDIHGYSPKDTKLYCRKAIEAAGLKVKS